MYRWKKRKERQAAIEAQLAAERKAREEQRRAEEEQRRAEEEQKRAEEEAKRAEEEQKRIEEEQQIATAAAEAEAEADAVVAAAKKARGGLSAADDEENDLDLEEDDGLTPEERQHLKEKEAILKLIEEKPEEVAWLIKMWIISDEK